MIGIQMTLLSFIAYFNHANTESNQFNCDSKFIFEKTRLVERDDLGDILSEEYTHYFHNIIGF